VMHTEDGQTDEQHRVTMETWHGYSGPVQWSSFNAAEHHHWKNNSLLSFKILDQK